MELLHYYLKFFGFFKAIKQHFQILDIGLYLKLEKLLDKTCLVFWAYPCNICYLILIKLNKKLKTVTWIQKDKSLAL